jgi:Fe-S cluster assembly iron-binding protein IscA
MNYAKKNEDQNKSDEVVVSHGVSVYVDPKAIFFLVGTEMDFTVI